MIIAPRLDPDARRLAAGDVLTHRCFLAVMLALALPVAGAADMGKTLHAQFSIAESSFDSAAGWDAASDAVIEHILDPMLEYEYLARPVKLKPNTLERMPEVSADGSVYLCRVRKGIFFTPDPAFKGKQRELTAADYAYSLRRLLDPAVRSPWMWLVEGKLAGGDTLQAQAKKTGRFDYDTPLAGLEIVDRYTLRIRLTQPDYTFLYILAMPSTAALAREVVEAYGNDIGAHPVGSGPYRLAEYKRSSRIVLEANPGFRGEIFAEAATGDPGDAAIARHLTGKRLPLIGRVEISVIEEDQARWLAFLDRQFDYLQRLPTAFVDLALDNGRLKPEFTARGIRQFVLMLPNAWWAYFNMQDPLVGGYTAEKIALRRAISMAFNTDEFIRVIFRGRATAAQGPIPPGIAGYDPKLKTAAQIYDPGAARALLDKFGYRDRDGDGYRELPDGQPLTIERWSAPTLRERQIDELWKKNMDAIGIRMVFRKDKLPELRKMARAGKIQVRNDGWNADYPDAENFMQLLYGPNIGQGNDSRFSLPEFDRLYEQARKLPDSPERTRIFDQMTELMLAYAPWKLTHHLIEDHLVHAWVLDYKPHPIHAEIWKYLDIDPALRK
jgi:ABC-type transport system substrate-binding protein